MCGLIAMISKTHTGFSEKELTTFQQGLYTTAIRGTDATGAFLVTAAGNVELIKNATPSADFIRTKEYDEWSALAYTTGKIVVGHCRAATKGEKTDENAHPFISENIALVHNGTLWSHEHLAKTTTDSEAIAVSFSKNDPKEIIPDLNGAYALLWYDAKHKTFHASRNKERPLWILSTPTIDFIASEPGMLEWLYNRNAFRKEDAKYFETDAIFNWDLDNLKDSFTETKLKKKPPTPTKTTGAGVGVGVSKKYLLCEDLYYGDRLKLDVVKSVTIYNSVYLEASHNRYPNLSFRCYIGAQLARREELLKCKKFLGTVSGKQSSDNKTFTIIVTDAFPITETDTDTITLTDIHDVTATVSKEQCYCSRCNIQILEKDTKKIWFRHKKGLLKTIYCPICVQFNTNLKVVK